MSSSKFVYMRMTPFASDFRPNSSLAFIYLMEINNIFRDFLAASSKKVMEFCVLFYGVAKIPKLHESFRVFLAP